MELSRNITVIPARKRVGNTAAAEQRPKLKVAAYCRVSTDSEEQASSYEVQVAHYTQFIQKNPEWELAGIYADDGITGTKTKKREEFNRMIQDCMDGNIDMIITKSISRFARNTLDCLKYIRELKEKIAGLSKSLEQPVPIISDLIHPGDFVVLVTPIDSAAPKGRLILPQQQTIRDILEADAASIVVKDSELKETLDSLGKKPRMVITDSQACRSVSEDTPEDILLTSFSILFARYMGRLEPAVQGVRMLDKLKEGDKILISEGCTHHRQCDDIGTVKIPRWIEEYMGKHFQYEWSSGTEFPENLREYGLIIHCGGCMLNEREMKYRQKCAGAQEIPMTNYGILIAHTQGILRRSLEPFPDILKLLEE